ncbi:hypothetical protein ATCC90586_011927 [Pythium insidiosum]|nr:hypothetical protein ATCC90586_011927 [Pythium insidiosum]
MVSRFVEIHPSLSRLDHASMERAQLQQLMLPPADVERAVNLNDQLRELDEVTKALQDPTLTMVGARSMFDAVVERYPSLNSRLGPRAAIVNNPALESGIEKIIRGQRLCAAEEVECARFRSDAPVTTVAPATSIIAKAFKRQRLIDAKTRYIGLGWVPPTSNECERLFSAVKWILTDARKGMLDDTLEFLVYLKANRFLWDIKEVDDVVRRIRQNNGN